MQKFLLNKKHVIIQVLLVFLSLFFIRWGLKKAWLTAVPGNSPVTNGILSLLFFIIGTGLLFLFVMTLKARSPYSRNNP